jgi:hypothetical protein
MYYHHNRMPEIMRLVGQLLIEFADQQAGAPEGMVPMPNGDDFPAHGVQPPAGFPIDPNGMPDLSHAPPFVQDLLKQLMPGGAMPGAEGLYGTEDLPGTGVLPEEATHDLRDTVQPRPFDPHDLPLEKYEDCAEKSEQERVESRRDTLRDDPLKWIDQAIYYALQMVDDKCDAEDAARSFLCLPGGPTLRTQKAVNANVADEYDQGWAQANNHIQTAYDSDRIDSTDFQDCMRRLGEPIGYGARDALRGGA